MPFGLACKIDGLQDLVNKLRAKGEKVQRTKEKALRAGAQPIKQLAKARAPVRGVGAKWKITIPGYHGGLLKRAVSVKVGTSKRTGATYALIGVGRAFKMVRPRGSKTREKRVRKALLYQVRSGQSRLIAPEYYLHLVELGVQEHALGKGSSIRKGIQTGHGHPGFPGRHFLEQAFRARLAQARDIIAAELRRAIAA